MIKTILPQHRTESVIESDQEKLDKFHEKIQQLDKQDVLSYVYRALRIIDLQYSQQKQERCVRSTSPAIIS